MNINRNELKEALKQIKINDYKLLEGQDVFELTLVMLEHLGDTDPELRDELIYNVFCNWAGAGNYTKDQIKRIISIGLDDNHLLYNIGEESSDSVFMRAFSVLVVAVAVYLHRKDPILSYEELREIKNKVIDYMSKEKDVRGYVKEGGWAHTAAHSADALDELAQCEEIGQEDLLDILKAIKNKVCINYHAYICYEDERLAFAVNSLINRNILSETEIAEWISSFKNYDGEKVYPEHYYLLSNMRNFLNSLYYRLPKGNYDIIKAAIRETVLIIRNF